MKEITLEEEFTQEELKLILDIAEYMLDRDAYQDEDDERCETLLSVLKKLGSEVIDRNEEDEREEDFEYEE